MPSIRVRWPATPTYTIAFAGSTLSITAPTVYEGTDGNDSYVLRFDPTGMCIDLWENTAPPSRLPAPMPRA